MYLPVMFAGVDDTTMPGIGICRRLVVLLVAFSLRASFLPALPGVASNRVCSLAIYLVQVPTKGYVGILRLGNLRVWLLQLANVVQELAALLLLEGGGGFGWSFVLLCPRREMGAGVVLGAVLDAFSGCRSVPIRLKLGQLLLRSAPNHGGRCALLAGEL